MFLSKLLGEGFIHKRHDYVALLKYMKMLEDGYSVGYIANKFGVNRKRLKCS